MEQERDINFYSVEEIEESDEDDQYDEEHAAILGFMRGYRQDQNGLIDDFSF